ncbi:hypothetical protein FOA52_015059 [Chlamydomonas sp. UWO 241]|nr:hypothetical protein FOA52_015059 [Chlamydomonas sp. UWO 241]
MRYTIYAALVLALVAACAPRLSICKIVINTADPGVGRAAKSQVLSQEERDEAFVNYKEGKKKIAASACRDTDPNCESWASGGECENNAGFMKETCPVACKDCTPAELNAAEFYGQTFIFCTSHGDIRVTMNWDNAPRSCALVLDLAHQPECPRCNFYRPELAPTDGTGGPPYGLLQGSLTGLLRSLPREGKGIPAKYGAVASIQGTDFYIAAMDHSDWGTAHTVWGEVQNMEVVEEILKSMTYHENKHPVGTIMRMADTPLHFSPSFKVEHEL